MKLHNEKCTWEKNFSQAEVDEIFRIDALHKLSSAEWKHIDNSKDMVLLKLMSIALANESYMNH